MATFYLYLLIAGIVVILLSVFWRPEKIFEFPQFMASTFAGFVVPQGFSLIAFPGMVRESAIDAVMLMSCLCLACCVIGYQFRPIVGVLRTTGHAVHPGRMAQIALAFTLVGYVLSFLYGQMEIQFHETRAGMTGLGTILLFFMNVRFIGFAIFLALLLQRFSWTRLGMVLFSGASPLIAVIVYGRREPAVTIALTILLGLYFYRNVRPPRLLVFGALALAMLAIPATSAYRSAAKSGIKEIRKIDLVGNFKEFLNSESILELRNAAAIIESAQAFGSYELGAGYWNQLVFRYVPAQLVGRAMKDSLLIGTTVDRMFKKSNEFGHEFSVGATVTGMGDSFRQFSWFGCLVFIPMGMFFRSLWAAALRPGAFFAQILYMLSMTSAMLAITHQTVDFLPGLLYQFMFLWLGLFYANDRIGETELLYDTRTSCVPQTGPVSRGSLPPERRQRYTR